MCTLWNPIGNARGDKTNDSPAGTLNNGDHSNDDKAGENSKPKLSEDYAELGHLDDEGDYSTPAGKLLKGFLNVLKC